MIRKASNGNNARLPIGKGSGICAGHNAFNSLFIPIGILMRSIIVVAALLISASPVLAQLQVPAECTELAAREGFPTTTLTKLQAARARARMALLSDRDPLVKQCRVAIRQAIAMRKEMEKSSKSSGSQGESIQ
jgi:hypothetical protein